MALNNEEFLKQMRDTTDHLVNGSRHVDQSWREIALSVERTNQNNTRGWAAAFLKLGGIQGRVLEIGNNIRQTLDNPEFAQGFAKASLEKLKLLQDAMVSLHTSGEADLQSGREKMAQLEKETAHILHQQQLMSAIAAVMKSEAAIFLPSIVNWLKTSVQQFDFMRAGLKQANAGWQEQAVLLTAIARAQAATGASSETMRESAAALVKHGFDLKDGFKDNLEIVTKMKVGLEVSADSAAEMLAIMNRLHTSGAGVADAIARIKADTALSAEQATRFAIEIGRAMSVLRPGAGAQTKEIVEYIGRLEGASQSLGLTVGSVKDMLTGFTKESGMMGIATLGFQPDFLADLNKTKAVTEGFVSYVEKQLTGSTGYQRMVTLQLLAQQFGTTTDVIGNARAIMEEFNKQQKSNTSLTREWSEATKTFSGTSERLRNSMAALFHTIILPFIPAVARITGVLADFVGWIAKSKIAATALGVALGIVVIKTLAAVASLKVYGDSVIASSFKGMLGKIAGSLPGGGAAGWQIKQMASGSMSRQMILQVLKSWLPRLGWLQRIGSVLGAIGTSAAGLVVAAGAAGAALGYGMRKVFPSIDTTVQKMFTHMMKSSTQFAHETKMSRMGSYRLSDFDRELQKIMNQKGSTAKDVENFVRTKGMQVDIIAGQTDKKERDRLVKLLATRAADAEHVELRQRAMMTVTAYDKESLEAQASITPAIDRLTDCVELQNDMMHRADDEASGKAAIKRAEDDHRALLQELDRLINRPNSTSWQPGSGNR